jgi:hypothetical protein
MSRKVLAVVIVALAASLASAVYARKAAGQTSSAHRAAQPAADPGATAAQPSISESNPETECGGAPCAMTPKNVSVANNPAPPVDVWPWQERISWAANLLLMLMSYPALILAVSLLRKIERQMRYVEIAAEAASESAKSALSLAQAQEKAERPWILVTPETMPGIPDAFTVVATNRGRSPARIISLSEGLAFARDESYLPEEPSYRERPSHVPLASLILLPGESVGIMNFQRDDVRAISSDPEQLRRVEDWEEKIYLYGKVTYIDLRFPDEGDYRETAWCCWYIHGRQKSGLVNAGAPQYNQHT